MMSHERGTHRVDDSSHRPLLVAVITLPSRPERKRGLPTDTMTGSDHSRGAFDHIISLRRVADSAICGNVT
jgi:hypothetical protein